MQGVFLLMQQGTTGSCQGGMMFTTRKGVWEAEAALAWEKICSEMNVGLIQAAELDRLLVEVEPESVNNFAKDVMKMFLA
ncbi:hypothetical protein H9L39_17901 [Fusarium oxysporum f. sp. albedinis]|nr:hypothetical protein H9L39_17901 [Fusarium oxysporum f. sp. albedinis]